VTQFFKSSHKRSQVALMGDTGEGGGNEPRPRERVELLAHMLAHGLAGKAIGTPPCVIEKRTNLAAHLNVLTV